MRSPRNIASRRSVTPRRARPSRAAPPSARRRSGASSSRCAGRRRRRRTGRPRSGSAANSSASVRCHDGSANGGGNRTHAAEPSRAGAAAGSRNTVVAVRRTVAIGSDRSPSSQRVDHGSLGGAGGEHQPRPRAVHDRRRQRHPPAAVERRHELDAAIAREHVAVAGRPRRGVPVVADPEVHDVEAVGQRARVAAGGGAQIGRGDRHQPHRARQPASCSGVAVGVAVGRDPLVDLPDGDRIPGHLVRRAAPRSSPAPCSRRSTPSTPRRGAGSVAQPAGDRLRRRHGRFVGDAQIHCGPVSRPASSVLRDGSRAAARARGGDRGLRHVGPAHPVLEAARRLRPGRPRRLADLHRGARDDRRACCSPAGSSNLRLLLDRSTLASVVAASLLLTVNWSTYVWAVSNDHVIDTALGYFLAPLGTMAIGVFVLGERLTPLKRVVDRVRRRGGHRARRVVRRDSVGCVAAGRVLDVVRVREASGRARSGDEPDRRTARAGRAGAWRSSSPASASADGVPQTRHRTSSCCSCSAPASSPPSRCCCSRTPPSGCRSRSSVPPTI